MAGWTVGEGGRKRFHRPISEINVTPFVDVMLVLLIIFMVTSPMLIAGVSVDLPNSEASPVSSQEEPLSVTVDKNGRIYIQETEVKYSELIPRLYAIIGEKKDTRIFVRGDKSIDYGKVMRVLGAINGAGFNKVALITEVEQ